MSAASIRPRGARVSVLRGLPLALAILAGCGRHAAPPPAPPAKAKTEPPKTAAAPAPTNAPVINLYASVFEDLSAEKGKDPFYPYSHRRDPKIVTPTPGDGAPVAAVLELKGIIGGGQQSQVVINNQIFAVGDEREVRVPDGIVKVKCLDIGPDDVLVQVEGEAEPKRLKMAPKKELTPYGTDSPENNK